MRRGNIEFCPQFSDNIPMKRSILPRLILTAGLTVALSVFHLSAQEAVETPRQFDILVPEPQRPPLAPENPEDAPRQFRELSLGMALEELKTALIQDGLFSFRGDRDVSLIPVREQTLVETTGSSFIRRASFQLSGGQVYIMAFTLDTRLMDHYSVFTSFVKKYGEPLSLGPGEAVWESENTRVSIERPLTIKYIDKEIFNRLVEETEMQQQGIMILREGFLNDL